MISGIYIIKSLKFDDRNYIGSAISIKNRWAAHLFQLRRNCHHAKKLQNHYNKYGESDLEFRILNVCDKHRLIRKEQCYINIFNPYFNSSKTAGSRFGMKSSEETKRKIGLANKISCKGRKAWNKGIKLSKEHVYNLSISRKGGHWSESRRKNMQGKNCKPILQYDLDGNFIKEWGSTKVVAEEMKCCKTSIFNALNGIRPTARGFIFKYKHEIAC